MLKKEGKDQRERLQGVMDDIGQVKQQIAGLENDRKKAEVDCAKISLYYKMLKDYLKVG